MWCTSFNFYTLTIKLFHWNKFQLAQMETKISKSSSGNDKLFVFFVLNEFKHFIECHWGIMFDSLNIDFNSHGRKLEMICNKQKTKKQTPEISSSYTYQKWVVQKEWNWFKLIPLLFCFPFPILSSSKALNISNGNSKEKPLNYL